MKTIKMANKEAPITMIILLLLLNVFQLLKAQIVNNQPLLTGYDCGNRITNVTTISLVEVEECNIEAPKLNITTIYGQVLQINHFKSTKVYQCSIKLTRRIEYCTFNSHTSKVKNGIISFYKEVTRDECLRIQNEGVYRFSGTDIHDIPRNDTFVIPVSIAGSATYGGSCQGASYSDSYGTWDNVVVDGFIEFKNTEYEATINLDTNKIILNTGTTCALTDTRCIDMTEGYAFWSALPEDPCNTRKYSILYEGNITKTEEMEDASKTVYMVESEEVTFALSKVGERPLCGYNLIRTEHPKLFIVEGIREKIFETKSESSVANLDIFAYVNSKFVYVEKHIRKQVNRMYYDLLRHKCELERKVLQNALAIATQAPDEFAYRLMNSPGYMAINAGEVVHLIKCTQIEVTLRPTEECYHQLPVFKGETPYFLSPRTHILVRTGTQIECNILLPTMYQINNTWIEFTPRLSTVTEPATLKPLTKPTWRYLTAHALAMSGLYNNNDLEKLRDRIMFPVERMSVLNTVALGMAGRTVVGQGVSIRNFIDEKTLENIATSTWKKMWGSFISFGTASAGVLGFFIIGRLIKLIVDTVIHGYAIWSIYGFSCLLLGAVWNSVTQLLLHLGQNMRRSGEEAMQKSVVAKAPEDEGKDTVDEKIPQTHENRENIYEAIDHERQNPTYIYPLLPRANSTIVLPSPRNPNYRE